MVIVYNELPTQEYVEGLLANMLEDYGYNMKSDVKKQLDCYEIRVWINGLPDLYMEFNLYFSYDEHYYAWITMTENKGFVPQYASLFKEGLDYWFDPHKDDEDEEEEEEDPVIEPIYVQPLERQLWGEDPRICI